MKYKMVTRYSETGQDGIIHHSSYVVYLEEARIAYFNSIGLNINTIEKSEQFCPVVNLSIRYHKPLLSAQAISVSISLSETKKARFTLAYEIYREDELIATATSTNCFVDKSFKPIPLPHALLR